ncbi:Tat pathway signal sequence domain protein [Brevibacterium mcbrellneri ATCC 49030]|uniref:Tat pathway signal sequence domain protein n=1 Tax=Brevibacterium mcbrellneri ATCC 49030 TaxID=585530 RepID=D4YMU9_9MICO|nr:TlpA disulfide reductase family protein [Brevibacterium mcbrellneri]EFG47514.1 Tat pathway signal sequence domain protein [Brevibacterium mcbrellneri ATCC 49030]
MTVNRRKALTAVLATAALVATSACSTKSDSLAEQAGSGQGYVSGSGVVTQIPEAERGEPVNFDFTLLDGKQGSVKDYQPKLVVVNLWYAACPPCRKEAPALNEAATKFADDVEFLGVNVRDGKAAAEGFTKTFDVKYANALDTDGSIVAALSEVLPPQATPSTVILDQEGRPAARVVGAVEESTLRGLIEETLGN